ncbi:MULTISPECIES: DUF1120 domain-containing protein [unclassified Pseudomonas]|uniref:DUF1120 domain-containing protein n=1 Tax=unclassified Pseudomonas TaxID=196821 RepID=UPI002AC931C5|nr:MULTISPECIES: DUF1120 domain-containing protein [unclassified Pseudomonas]MEB0044366.1 DUF1120 domain-containing protein [Pseudomonas sp. Dout3]MEB0094697.1 DUF1120 domain-containing protein [Pseudomonas sp. DC1.2]WPX59936.1 DUF1120 domain-containing protein [Pseudomonas sp. DC1.2]
MKFVQLTLAALPLIAGSALAAQSVDLSIKGLVSPTSCTPVLSGSGVIDYGKISQQDLKFDQGTRLPVRHLALTIACNGQSRFALRMRDNRDGSANVNSEIYYGLGRDPSGNKIGLYSVSFDPTQTTADLLPQIYGTESTTAGVAWRSASVQPIDIGARSYLGFTDIAGSTAGPIALQNLSSTITVETVISAKQNLDLSREIYIDGSATLEVVYL